MMRRTLAAGLGLAVAACGGNAKPTVSATKPPVPVVAAAQQPAPPPKAGVDPVAALIATSQKHFDAGERELAAGHLEKARQEFDRSVEVLLESPYGARTDARMRDHFDRLIDRVNAHEVTALAQGDGFVEKKYEAAPIDEILKNATTFPAPVADAATKATVKADLEHNPHDIPIPEHPKVLSYVGVTTSRRAWHAARSTCR
jgi:membrane-bound lytic murein transglycosylase D